MGRYRKRGARVKKFRVDKEAVGEQADLLFVAWVQKMAIQRFRITGYGTDGAGSEPHGGILFRFGNLSKSGFRLNRSRTGEWRLESARGIAESDIEEVIVEAMSKVAAGDFGDEVVYQTTIRTRDPIPFDETSMLNLSRLHMEWAKRGYESDNETEMSGWRRLGSRVVLEFAPRPPNAEPRVPWPLIDAKVNIFVPGPTASLLTNPVADAIADVTAAVCVFASGTSVQAAPMLFPANEENSAQARILQHDESIPGLMRRNVSLDIFDDLESLGGDDAVSKVVGSLLAYHAAMQQASPDVALLLMVSSIEALTIPATKASWGKERPVKRFIDAVSDLCPAAVDEILDRRNVEFEFSYKKRGRREVQRKKLLDKIYELRSKPAHSGLRPAGFHSSLNPGSMRLAPLMDLASAAILSFLAAPRSFVSTHPLYEGDLQD